jgi:hypothetical protein
MNGIERPGATGQNLGKISVKVEIICWTGPAAVCYKGKGLIPAGSGQSAPLAEGMRDK